MSWLKVSLNYIMCVKICMGVSSMWCWVKHSKGGSTDMLYWELLGWTASSRKLCIHQR